MIQLLQRTVRGPDPPSRNIRHSAQEFATQESALRPGSSVVERGPEKAGVGGSIPSLATTQFNTLAEARESQAKQHRLT